MRKAIKMVEIHGWVTLRTSTGESDEDRIDRLACALRQQIEDMEADNPVIELKVLNAKYMIVVSGCTNHWGPAVDDVFRLLQRVGIEAPGSYGILYEWNDENLSRENEFHVWRLARGKLTEHGDALLSPCIPTIEDAM